MSGGECNQALLKTIGYAWSYLACINMTIKTRVIVLAPAPDKHGRLALLFETTTSGEACCTMVHGRGLDSKRSYDMDIHKGGVCIGQPVGLRLLGIYMSERRILLLAAK
jgi:hypothetical protein